MIAELKRFAVSAAVLASLLGAGGGALLVSAASANDCAARCYAQENACRRATQGSQSCDAQLTRCLQNCRSRR